MHLTSGCYVVNLDARRTFGKKGRKTAIDRGVGSNRESQFRKELGKVQGVDGGIGALGVEISVGICEEEEGGLAAHA